MAKSDRLQRALASSVVGVDFHTGRYTTFVFVLYSVFVLLHTQREDISHVPLERVSAGIGAHAAGGVLRGVYCILGIEAYGICLERYDQMA